MGLLQAKIKQKTYRFLESTPLNGHGQINGIEVLLAAETASQVGLGMTSSLKLRA